MDAYGWRPHRPRVFCASLADWLDDEVPIEWLVDLLELIRTTPNLDWQLLTKRPENWAGHIDHAGTSIDENKDLYEWIEAWQRGKPPANVWIGTTVENQEYANKRIPVLLTIPARIRFLSCEPLLGALDIAQYLKWGDFTPLVQWVICGGESGRDARSMNPDWSRSLRDQCENAKVPFFMKQMGGERKPFPEIPADLAMMAFPA